MQTRRWILKESTSPSKAAGSQSEAHPELYLFDVKPFFKFISLNLLACIAHIIAVK